MKTDVSNGEYVGLQEGHEQLQNHECTRNRNRPDAHEVALEHKDRSHEEQDKRMAGRHVGHKTDRQRERLRKLPQGLDDGQDGEHRRFHQDRQTGREEKIGPGIAGRPQRPESRNLDGDKADNGRAAVTEMFAVGVIPRGVSPIRFMPKTKKKIVRMNGVKASAPCPMFARTTSSRK